MLISIQPFGLNALGGGSRILRALFTEAPLSVLNVCTSANKPLPTSIAPEIHIPVRAAFGRLERSRLAPICGRVEPFFKRRFEHRLREMLQRATVVHAVAHGADCISAFHLARAQNLPFFITVHDDLKYLLRKRPWQTAMIGEFGRVWCESNGRFVISEAIGLEYCRRYGDRPFVWVTDGLTSFASEAKRIPTSGTLRIYFMGLFNLPYRENLRALLAALRCTEVNRLGFRIELVFRCGSLPRGFTDTVPKITVLPFDSEQAVAADLANADLLYFPLPFGKQFESSTAFSLSTKLVSYVGSGIPILYHGPEDSAAGNLLKQHDAAICVPSLDTKEIAAALRRIVHAPDEPLNKARQALRLAQDSFQLNDQRRKFWEPVLKSIN